MRRFGRVSADALIDLHCHLLPGIDDGPRDVVESLELARIACSEGITTIACTPHILPGVYDNLGPDIRNRTETLQGALRNAGIPITLVVGADIHMAPGVPAQLKSGQALSLNDTRYVLIEPPHHVLPPRVEHAFFNLASSGYTPVLTHPERMTWIEGHYDLIHTLARRGVLMQVTAGAVTGRFGRRARYWSERMLDDGIVHIIATDAHDAKRRPPLLRGAFEIVHRRIGGAEADKIFLEHPTAILEDRPILSGANSILTRAGQNSKASGLQRWFERVFKGA